MPYDYMISWVVDGAQLSQAAEYHFHTRAHLSRETLEGPSRDRVYANIVLYVNVHLRRREGRRERVVASFDLTPFVLTVELPTSQRASILSAPGRRALIAPTSHELDIPNAGAVGGVRAHHRAQPSAQRQCGACSPATLYGTEGTLETRLRALDARVPDRISAVELATLLPSHQQHELRQMASSRRVRRRQLIAVSCVVSPSERIAGRYVGASEIEVQGVYLARGRWVIVTPDGASWARWRSCGFYIASLAARRTLDCVIASHMIDKTGDVHVGYVSSEASRHDTC